MLNKNIYPDPQQLKILAKNSSGGSFYTIAWVVALIPDPPIERFSQRHFRLTILHFVHITTLYTHPGFETRSDYSNFDLASQTL